MFKYLLFALLIIRSSNLFCVDIEPEPFVKTEDGELFFEKNLIAVINLIHAVDFKISYLGCLTDTQLAVYQKQMDGIDVNMGLPLEYAAFLGEAEVVGWLLSNGAKISLSNPSKPLACALKCGLMNWRDQSKTVLALLAAGASTKGLIKGESLVGFMRRKLETERCNQTSDRSAGITKDMQTALVLLEQHERWSPERKAWTGAVLRGVRVQDRKLK